MKMKSNMAAAALMVLVIALGLFTACTDETQVEYEAPVARIASSLPPPYILIH